MDLLSQGREYYAKKDYKAALEAFTEVIRTRIDDTVIIALDHRAATLEKLGEFQLALKDARDMVILRPERAKGYLRYGKVLQLTGNETLALKLVERGLSKVKNGKDIDRFTLQRMHAKLQKGQSLDPLVVLPNEIALLIFHHMDIADRIKCLSVSRSWKRFLVSSPSLWKTLDLRLDRRNRPYNALKAYLRRSNYGLEEALLNAPLDFFSSGSLEMITQHCKKLKILECRNSKGLGDLGNILSQTVPQATSLQRLVVKDYRVLASQIEQILSRCPLLYHVQLDIVGTARNSIPIQWPHLGNLSSLILRSNERTFMRTLNLDKLITSTPNLRALTFGYRKFISGEDPIHHGLNFALWNKLELLELYGLEVDELPTLPPTINHLRVSSCHWRRSGIEPDEVNLPLLETFIFGGSTGFRLKFYSKMVKSSIEKRNLRTVQLCNQCPLRHNEYDKEVLATFACPELTRLSLKNWQITEEQLLEFLRLFPNLKHLDLSGTNVTGVAIKELMTRASGPLKKLGLNECHKLWYDAVEYACGLGCSVEYKMRSSYI